MTRETIHAEKPHPSRLLLTLDLMGTFVFALEGALAAVEGDLDLLGLMVLSFATALGGGIIRDVLIGAIPPGSIRDWRLGSVAFLGGASSSCSIISSGKFQPADSQPGCCRSCPLRRFRGRQGTRLSHPPFYRGPDGRHYRCRRRYGKRCAAGTGSYCSSLGRIRVRGFGGCGHHGGCHSNEASKTSRLQSLGAIVCSR